MNASPDAAPAAPRRRLSEVTPETPWLGLRSFTREVKEYFFGREAELADLFERVVHRPLTILFGQSGLGKTSLLQAALVPRLEEAGFRPILIRLDYADGAPPLEQQVVAALRLAVPEARGFDGALGLWEIFHDPSCGFLIEGAPKPVLLFDQFEEIFTLGGSEKWRAGTVAFREALAALVENRPPAAVRARIEADDTLADRFNFHAQPCKVLLSLREDFLHQLERWRRSMPLLMENRLELRLLTGPQALRAVVEPGRLRCSNSQPHRTDTASADIVGPSSTPPPPIVNDDTGAAIVRFVAGAAPDMPLAEIDAVPPLLSLICAELNDQRFPADGSPTAPTIEPNQLEGRSEDILQRYYEDTFAPHSPALRHFVEDRLLSADGHFRESVAEETALAELTRAGLRQDTARLALAALVDERLLTAEERGGARRIELTHDVLTGVTRASREARLAREAQEKAERDATAARRQRARLRRLVAAFATLSLTAAGAAYFGLHQANEAAAAATETQKALHEARELERQAVLAATQAAESKRLAENAKAETSRISSRSNSELGAMLLDQGDPLKAAAYFATAFEQDPDNEINRERILDWLNHPPPPVVFTASESEGMPNLHDSELFYSPPTADSLGGIFYGTSYGYDPADLKNDDVSSRAIMISDRSFLALSAEGRAPYNSYFASSLSVSSFLQPGERNHFYAANAAGMNQRVEWTPPQNIPPAGGWGGFLSFRGGEMNASAGRLVLGSSKLLSPDEFMGVYQVHFGSADHFIGLSSYVTEDGRSAPFQALTSAPSPPIQQHTKWLGFTSDGRHAYRMGERMGVNDDGQILEKVDVLTGEPVGKSFILPERMREAWFCAASLKLVTLEMQNTYRLWDLADQREIPLPVASRLGEDSLNPLVAFSPSGDTLLVGSMETPTFFAVSITNGLVRFQIQTDSPLNGFAFTPDGTKILASAQDGKSQLYSSFDGAKLAKPFFGDVNLANFFSEDGRYLAAHEHAQFVIRDLVSGLNLPRLVGTAGDAEATSLPPDRSTVSHDGLLFATSGPGSTVELWETDSGKRRWAYPLEGRRIVFVRFVPKTEQLLVASATEADSEIHLLDLIDGRLVEAPLRISGTLLVPEGLVFSPAGRHFVVASADTTLRLVTSAPLRVLVSRIGGMDKTPGESINPRSVAVFDPSGNHVLIKSIHPDPFIVRLHPEPISAVTLDGTTLDPAALVLNHAESPALNDVPSPSTPNAAAITVARAIRRQQGGFSFGEISSVPLTSRGPPQEILEYSVLDRSATIESRTDNLDEVVVMAFSGRGKLHMTSERYIVVDSNGIAPPPIVINATDSSIWLCPDPDRFLSTTLDPKTGRFLPTLCELRSMQPIEGHLAWAIGRRAPPTSSVAGGWFLDDNNAILLMHRNGIEDTFSKSSGVSSFEFRRHSPFDDPHSTVATKWYLGYTGPVVVSAQGSWVAAVSQGGILFGDLQLPEWHLPGEEDMRITNRQQPEPPPEPPNVLIATHDGEVEQFLFNQSGTRLLSTTKAQIGRESMATVWNVTRDPSPRVAPIASSPLRYIDLAQEEADPTKPFSEFVPFLRELRRQTRWRQIHPEAAMEAAGLTAWEAPAPHAPRSFRHLREASAESISEAPEVLRQLAGMEIAPSGAVQPAAFNPAKMLSMAHRGERLSAAHAAILRPWMPSATRPIANDTRSPVTINQWVDEQLAIGGRARLEWALTAAPDDARVMAALGEVVHQQNPILAGFLARRALTKAPETSLSSELRALIDPELLAFDAFLAAMRSMNYDRAASVVNARLAQTNPHGLWKWRRYLVAAAKASLLRHENAPLAQRQSAFEEALSSIVDLKASVKPPLTLGPLEERLHDTLFLIPITAERLQTSSEQESFDATLLAVKRELEALREADSIHNELDGLLNKLQEYGRQLRVKSLEAERLYYQRWLLKLRDEAAAQPDNWRWNWAIAFVHNRIGVALGRENNYAAALPHFSDALKLRQEVGAIFRDDERIQGHVESSRAHVAATELQLNGASGDPLKGFEQRLSETIAAAKQANSSTTARFHWGFLRMLGDMRRQLRADSISPELASMLQAKIAEVEQEALIERPIQTAWRDNLADLLDFYAAVEGLRGNSAAAIASRERLRVLAEAGLAAAAAQNDQNALIGRQYAVAEAIERLGDAQYLAGDLVAASRTFAEAVEKWGEVQAYMPKSHQSHVLQKMVHVARDQGEIESAAELARRALVLAREVETIYPSWDERHRERARAAALLAETLALKTQVSQEEIRSLAQEATETWDAFQAARRNNDDPQRLQQDAEFIDKVRRAHAAEDAGNLHE